MPAFELEIRLPDWLRTWDGWSRAGPTPAERMDLAIALAQRNVREETGGPFGAVVFEGDRPLAAGVNLVERGRNAFLHAETVALMLAQAARGSYSLRDGTGTPLILSTSCEPCAMCLGAILWSGIRRVECGAAREDAMRVGFDEGPVFAASYDYLAARGIEIERGIRRAEAAAVLEQYRRAGGVLYNG